MKSGTNSTEKHSWKKQGWKNPSVQKKGNRKWQNLKQILTQETPANLCKGTVFCF
jgi:hypothetical protein